MTIVKNMVLVALLVSLNHDDDGEENDDYDGSCRAFKAQKKYITGALRDGLTKKTAVLLDFVQITSPPHLYNLYNFF